MRLKTITLDVPVKSSSKLFTGRKKELIIYDGQIILPADIVDVIESRQKSLPEGERGLIYINDFLTEHRCIPHTEILSRLAHENEHITSLLNYIPQNERLDCWGRIRLPKHYAGHNTVILEPRGYYFALRSAKGHNRLIILQNNLI